MVMNWTKEEIIEKKKKKSKKKVGKKIQGMFTTLTNVNEQEQKKSWKKKRRGRSSTIDFQSSGPRLLYPILKRFFIKSPFSSYLLWKKIQIYCQKDLFFITLIVLYCDIY